MPANKFPPKRFHYVTVPAHHVADAALLCIEPDSYVAREEVGEKIKELLFRGYRWIRTDQIGGESYAIFEKEFGLTEESE
jgi:hypothetical protein